jgi:hypothetical protein
LLWLSGMVVIASHLCVGGLALLWAGVLRVRRGSRLPMNNCQSELAMSGTREERGR